MAKADVLRRAELSPELRFNEVFLKIADDLAEVAGREQSGAEWTG